LPILAYRQYVESAALHPIAGDNGSLTLTESRGTPLISVIIPAYRAWATLPSVLAALEPQLAGSNREVIVVESSGEHRGAALEQRWPWARFLTLPRRHLPGRARNLGARAARGEWLAFLDADAIPEADWLDQLERALGPGVDAVAGSVVNGTPGSSVGTAGYLLEFADWLPSAHRSLLHAATCNLIVRQTAFEELGGFVEDVFPGEDTIFTLPLARRGGLGFAPRACVRHLNRTSLREYLTHQRRLGKSFAEVCARVDFPHRAMGRPALAPLAVPFRLAALGRRLLRHPREALQALLLLPLLVLGLIAWGAGLAAARG
jgi:cellulose synthase/poly-beta-1,6-N-acetylglucosamine synthase-like glycosyltransferase